MKTTFFHREIYFSGGRKEKRGGRKEERDGRKEKTTTPVLPFSNWLVKWN